MKTILYKYMVVLLVLGGLAACSEDNLVKNSTGRYDSDNFLTTEEEAEQAIIGIYDYLSVAYNNFTDWSSLYLVKLVHCVDDYIGVAGCSLQPMLQFIF